MHNPPSRRIKMQQKQKTVDDWIPGEIITWKDQSGFVNFISNDYITMCIREYCKPDEDLECCKRRSNQVNILIFRQYWHEVISCDSK